MKEDHKTKNCKVDGKVCAHRGEKDKYHRTQKSNKKRQQIVP